MAKHTDPSRTFVAYTTTDNDDGGEACWAEKVVRHTGVEWIKIACTAADILEKTAIVNRAHSAPIYNPSSITQFRMMEEVKKQGQTVIIDGQGGDELLGGYPAYYPLFLQSLRKNGELRNWWNELKQVGNTGMTPKDILLRRLKLWAKTHYYTPQKLAQKKQRYACESLTPDVRDRYFDHPSPIPSIKKEVLNDALFESYTLFLGNILRWGEHSAASQGIECVTPLADHLDLTEFAFSVPSSFKIHDGWNKYLLRKAMEGIVPDEICRRKQKMGFYYPEHKWLNEIKNPLFETLQKMEDPEDCICKKYILENMNRLYTPANPLYRQFIFRCYSYLLWRNSF
jgi:asparagine synthase (glutamine-hydrolysing)